MKTLQILIFGLLLAMIPSRAQELDNAGWYGVGGMLAPGAVTVSAQAPALANSQTLSLTAPPPNGPIAETNTPEIQALADGLQRDPVRIFNYVHDHIRFVLYFGPKKGGQLTLLEKSGNDFDQCALLVALLRAAGYSNSGYQFGWMLMPYDNPDGSHRDIHHWLGLSLTNSNWSYTAGYLDTLLTGWRFYPLARHSWGNNIYAFQRVWVTLTIGGITYYLDPAFKVSEPIAGINLPSAMGFSSNALMNAAQGMSTGNYVTNLNESAIQGMLTSYTTNLREYIQSNCPNASVEEVLGGQFIVPSTNATLESGLPFATTNMDGTMPVISWINQPTNMIPTIGITFAGINFSCYIPQLLGQRLSLTVSSSGSAQLWQDDTLLATGSTGGGSGSALLGLKVRHPAFHGGWDAVNNLFVPADPSDSYAAPTYASYKNANANYAILYSFEPDWGWLHKRQQKLDDYRQQGYSDTSRQVLTETLNIMGLNWELQEDAIGKLLAIQIGVLPQHAHRMGRMGQENGNGYYVDIYKNVHGSSSSGGSSVGPAGDPYTQKWSDLCLFASAMEHGLIEQLQSTNLVAASTVKMLQFANANHQAVFLASSTNWASIKGQLKNYTLSHLQSFIDAGYTLLLPGNGNNQINGSGSWSGYGFMVRFVGGAQMLIGQGVYGGYVSNPSATVSPSWVNYSAYSQPLYFSSVPVSLPSLTGADPVSMADGTFQVQATDLAIGHTDPRGLNFTRYYSSSRRNSNLAGIAPGWVHNYYLNAATISSPLAGMGGTTPAQCAPMLVATCAAVNLFNGEQRDPKNWLVTALIAKWGVDQLTAKAVSVTLGSDTVQFIKQPDGRYTPPANCTMTLLQTNSGYWLQERHGRLFKFNAAGWATNISDPYGASLNLTYNSSNWVSTATDWKGRSLTFNYSIATPKRLISVVDSTGRSVLLGYSLSNDLATIADPENKTNRFLYDNNHQITATFDALGQLVASNIYNAFGLVTTQFTKGDPNQIWKIYCSGWQTVSQDPAGGQQSYIYDDKTRLIARQDALGNISRNFYDGQDHVVTNISPLNEVSHFIYDGNNNLRQIIDTLNATNQYFYDDQNNLVRVVDPLGNPSTFGYNTQFSMTGQTNGAGDWVKFNFNSDGTSHDRIDADSTNTFDTYDSWGQLTHITYPGSFGGESFVNNALGDPTSHTDARGFTTTFQYNLRRELTNTIATADNIAVKISMDAVGNVASTTDARGNTTSNTWSATRQLLATTLPSTAQGVPMVTNVYDNRDWLIRSVDPLGKPILYTNDAAGRAVSVTDQLQRTTRFGFDADGRNWGITNAALAIVSSQTFDARGRSLKAVDGALHSVLSAYDAAGNRIILTNRNNKKWQFQFDAANRLTNTITPLGRSTKLTFNQRGLVSTIQDQANKIATFYYDAKGRLTNRTDTLGTTLLGYDANDNRTNAVENNLTNSWTYDAYNRVSTYRDIYGNLIQYRYDANGNITNLIYPGNRVVTYAYDRLNRLTNITDWAQRKTSIGYDLASHLTSIKHPNGSSRTIGYDAAGQATNVVEQVSDGMLIAIFKFNWADTGNMHWEFAAPLPHAATVPTRTMTYDDDNRLLTINGSSVTSDDNGNLTYAPLTNGTFATQMFDARNRLANVGGVANVYDPLNNRVAQTEGTNLTVYVVNPNAGLSQVLMRIKNGVTNYYVYGVGLQYQITETATATNTLTYHYDYRGSTIALSADNGLVTDRVEYAAYGLTTYRTGTNDTPFLLNGKYGVQTDGDGLLYMQARYYNPYLCRFVSSDPSGFGGGLNTYAYANGNPVSLIDPFGLGARESSVDLSWFNAPTASQQQMQGFLTDFVNLVTLGTANDASTAFTGRDLYGNLNTRQERYVAAAMFGMAVVPFGKLEQTASRAGIQLAERTSFSAAAETTASRVLTEAEAKLYGRASHPQDFREQVWEMSKAADGNVYDPTGRILKFDEPWELGHTPANKFSDAQLRAAQEGWDRQTWIRYQNDPATYRPELPSSNASHKWE